MTIKEKFFIQRPHAIEQFKMRARPPKSWGFDRIEEELRVALEDADMAGEFKASKNEGEFVVRIALPHLQVVYALVVPGTASGKYEFMVPTIYDQEMYQQWNTDGKLGTVADVDEAKVIERLAPVIKPTLYLRYKNGGNQPTTLLEYTTDDISHQIAKLLTKGVRFNEIEVFRKVEFSMSINIGGEEK